MSQTLAFDILKQAVASHAAAFRCVTEYQPAGGIGDKVFPPTYKGGKYAVEKKRILDGGEFVDCVLLDSVQSQANRMESALLEARRAGWIELPLVTVRFDHDSLKKKFTVTSLEAPHRVADAILRDSLLDGVMFRRSGKGKALDTADVKNATDLFGLCPTAGQSPGCCKFLSGMRVLWTQYVVHETVVRVPRLVSVAAAVRSRSYRSRARIGKPVG